MGPELRRCDNGTQARACVDTFAANRLGGEFPRVSYNATLGVP